MWECEAVIFHSYVYSAPSMEFEVPLSYAVSAIWPSAKVGSVGAVTIVIVLGVCPNLHYSLCSFEQRNPDLKKMFSKL